MLLQLFYFESLASSHFMGTAKRGARGSRVNGYHCYCSIFWALGPGCCHRALQENLQPVGQCLGRKTRLRRCFKWIEAGSRSWEMQCRHMRRWWIDLFMFVFGEVVFAAVNRHLYPDSLPAYLGSFLEGNRTHHRWTPAMQLWGCVGFTIFDHVFGDPNVAQCCFLRRATRWQPNFRRATCHLARGAQTRSGCFCQASLSFMSQKAS